MSMAEFFYKRWYEEDVAPNLSNEEKVKVAKRISNLTLAKPIWLDRDKDYREQFPELEPFAHCQISGLQLCTVMESIVKDLTES